VANGAIANSRIINSARSPRAQVRYSVKFGVRASDEVIDQFKRKLYGHVKARPREWLKPVSFRLDKVSVDDGYVEYVVFLQHRESWQQIGAIKDSLAAVQRYSLQLSFSLGIAFQPTVGSED
jgi:hypothetical protein